VQDAQSVGLDGAAQGLKEKAQNLLGNANAREPGDLEQRQGQGRQGEGYDPGVRPRTPWVGSRCTPLRLGPMPSTSPLRRLPRR